MHLGKSRVALCSFAEFSTLALNEKEILSAPRGRKNKSGEVEALVGVSIQFDSTVPFGGACDVSVALLSSKSPAAKER